MTTDTTPTACADRYVLTIAEVESAIAALSWTPADVIIDALTTLAARRSDELGQLREWRADVLTEIVGLREDLDNLIELCDSYAPPTAGRSEP